VSLEDRLKSMSPVQALIIGLALMGIYYLAVFKSGEATKTSSSQMRIEISNKKLELEKADRLISQNQSITQDEREKLAYLNEVMQIVPTEFTGTELMRILSNEIKASGASLVRLVDSTPAVLNADSKNFLERVQVQVEVQGTFSQILVFLSYLTRVDRLLVLGDYKIETSAESTRARGVKFTADVFGYKANPALLGDSNAKQ